MKHKKTVAAENFHKGCGEKRVGEGLCIEDLALFSFFKKDAQRLSFPFSIISDKVYAVIFNVEILGYALG